MILDIWSKVVSAKLVANNFMGRFFNNLAASQSQVLKELPFDLTLSYLTSQFKFEYVSQKNWSCKGFRILDYVQKSLIFDSIDWFHVIK